MIDMNESLARFPKGSWHPEWLELCMCSPMLFLFVRFCGVNTGWHWNVILKGAKERSKR